MHPSITGQVISIDHPLGNGRFLSTESLYLYSLLWDPFILNRTQAVPQMRLCGEEVESPADTLLLYAHPTPVHDESAFRAVLRAGGRVVFNHPADPGFRSLPGLKQLGTPPLLVSLRERWDLGSLASRTYFYADRSSFLRLNASLGKALSWIGDNPDLMVVDDVALFAGNPFATLMSYMNVPFYSTMLLDVAALLVNMVSLMLDAPVSPQEAETLRSSKDLRRDFHAFGYAYLMILELERCYGGKLVDLKNAEGCVLEAARCAVDGEPEEAIALLTSGFGMLERQNRKLQPTPAIFTDTLHGGGLFSDLGYFEFDWPQHAADVLRTHLQWVNTRSYRYNVDFGAVTVANMADRFPLLFEALRAAQDAGLVEFVNGTMNQPYPPFHTLESQIRQLDLGRSVFETVFGCQPTTYASQEFGFCPQLAAILAQQGYEHVVLRVQNMGDAPTVNEERILWAAPNGARIEALPSHPYKTEQRNEATYNNLHLKLFAHQQTGLDFAVFTGLGDITYYRPFREELARICHYAPIFGRFETWSGYFAGRPRHVPVERSFNMEDFDCRAGFLELARWSVYQNVTGNFNSHCMRSMAATCLFSAAEMLEAVVTMTDPRRRSGTQRDWDWKALTVYQGHDSYIVPYHPAGGFMGGVNNPRSLAAGRAIQNVTDYCGPWDSLPVLKRAEADLEESESNATESIRRNLRQLVTPLPGCEQYVVYNPGPARRCVLRFKGSAGTSLTCEGNLLETQDAGRDLLASIPMPAYAYVVTHQTECCGATPAADERRVLACSDSLENALVRAEFDLRRGTLERLIRKTDGKDLLAEGGHAFYLPESRSQRCLRSNVMMEGPLRACLEFVIEIAVRRGRSCRIRSRVSLDVDDSVLRFEERVLYCPELRGDQWENHLGVRFGLFESSPVWSRCHFNVLEPARQERVFSPILLLAHADDTEVLFINHGNQFYVCRGAEASSILLFENEPAREFSYAIGYSEGNPLMEARSRVQPCFVERVSRRSARQADRTPSCPSHVPFFCTDSSDVEITSCRRENGYFALRLASTTDRETQVTLSAFCGIDEALMTDLRGQNGEFLEVTEGKAHLVLRPWDLRQVMLRPGSQS